MAGGRGGNASRPCFAILSKAKLSQDYFISSAFGQQAGREGVNSYKKDSCESEQHCFPTGQGEMEDLSFSWQAETGDGGGGAAGGLLVGVRSCSSL